MFELTETEMKRIEMWKRSHDCTIDDESAMGGKYTYCFTPTIFGTIKIVKCGCGAEYNVTNYDER